MFVPSRIPSAAVTSPRKSRCDGNHNSTSNPLAASLSDHRTNAAKSRPSPARRASSASPSSAHSARHASSTLENSSTFGRRSTAAPRFCGRALARTAADANPILTPTAAPRFAISTGKYARNTSSTPSLALTSPTPPTMATPPPPETARRPALTSYTRQTHTTNRAGFVGRA